MKIQDEMTDDMTYDAKGLRTESSATAKAIVACDFADFLSL